jgi:hypothetical protein
MERLWQSKVANIPALWLEDKKVGTRELEEHERFCIGKSSEGKSMKVFIS